MEKLFFMLKLHLAKGILVLGNVETSFFIFSKRDSSALGFELMFLFLKNNLGVCVGDKMAWR